MEMFFFVCAELTFHTTLSRERSEEVGAKLEKTWRGCRPLLYSVKFLRNGPDLYMSIYLLIFHYTAKSPVTHESSRNYLELVARTGYLYTCIDVIVFIIISKVLPLHLNAGPEKFD